MKTLIVRSCKGRRRQTTLAVNLAAAYAQGARTLIIDLVQGDVSESMKAERALAGCSPFGQPRPRNGPAPPQARPVSEAVKARAGVAHARQVVANLSRIRGRIAQILSLMQ